MRLLALRSLSTVRPRPFSRSALLGPACQASSVSVFRRLPCEGAARPSCRAMAWPEALDGVVTAEEVMVFPFD